MSMRSHVVDRRTVDRPAHPARDRTLLGSHVGPLRPAAAVPCRGRPARRAGARRDAERANAVRRRRAAVAARRRRQRGDGTDPRAGRRRAATCATRQRFRDADVLHQRRLGDRERDAVVPGPAGRGERRGRGHSADGKAVVLHRRRRDGRGVVMDGVEDTRIFAAGTRHVRRRADRFVDRRTAAPEHWNAADGCGRQRRRSRRRCC